MLNKDETFRKRGPYKKRISKQEKNFKLSRCWTTGYQEIP